MSHALAQERLIKRHGEYTIVYTAISGLGSSALHQSPMGLHMRFCVSLLYHTKLNKIKLIVLDRRPI